MRINPKEIKDYPWYIRPFFWLQRRKYGRPLNSSLIWAMSPRLFFGISVLFRGLDRAQSPIPPAMRSLIIVRVSQLNGCMFCVDLNSYILMKRGADYHKLTALSEWKESSLFDDKEKAVLEYAEAITISNLSVSDSLMDKLKGYYTESEIIELTAIIAFQNMSTKFNTALDIPPQGFCILP